MSSYLHLGWFVLLALIPTATGRGNGAPPRACESMAPKHIGVLPETSNSPYTLEVKRSEDDNDTMQVCVKGKSFKGILGQVRIEGKSTPIGTFDGANLPPNTKLMKCTADDDSVTHSNTNDKNDTTCFVWKIHDKNSKSKLQFVATIAEAKETYWVKLASDVFVIAKDSNSGAAPGVTFTAVALSGLLAVFAGMLA